MLKSLFKKKIKPPKNAIMSMVQHNITFDRLNAIIEKEINEDKPENQAERLRKRLSVMEQ